MTDVTKLANELFKMINQQRVPEQIDKIDLCVMIVEAIKDLYVVSGRSSLWDDSKVVYDQPGYPHYFEDVLKLDEERWVQTRAEIAFFKWVQASVDDQVSYTTDAMSVAHGDKPYEHIGSTIDRLEKELFRIWYAMTRFNQLGVSG